MLQQELSFFEVIWNLLVDLVELRDGLLSLRLGLPKVQLVARTDVRPNVGRRLGLATHGVGLRGAATHLALVH